MKHYVKSAYSFFAILLFLSISLIGKHSFAQYCEPSFIAGCDDGTNINSVILTGENNTSINDLNTGCASNGYDDKTSLPAVELFRGENYTINISTQMNELMAGTSAALWIDFNDNFTFEPNERVAVYNGLLSLSGTDINIHIPANAPLGVHRLRVMGGMGMLIGDMANEFDPCPSFLSGSMAGEIHDYHIHVLDPGTTTEPCENPIVNLGGEVSLCDGGSVVLDAGNPGLTYLWNNGATTQTITVDAVGSYYVTVTDGSCSTTDTVQVVAFQSIDVDGIEIQENANASYTFSAINPVNVNTYHWDFGDGNTANGASVTHSYAQAGNYTVTLTVSNNCEEESITTALDAVVSILESNASQSFVVYPNPVKSVLNIQHDQLDEATALVIYDVVGRVVYQTNLNSEKQVNLSLNTLNNGLYIIEIIHPEFVMHKKVEVSR